MRHRSYKAAIVVLALLITGVSPALAGFGLGSAPDAKLAELERTIEFELAQTGTPGAAILVVQGDRVIFAKGFGRISVEGGMAVSPDTLFRIGSTTKMFTAAAFATLAERSRVRFDTPVGSYIPGLPTQISRLTGHQLLSQSSGLRDMNTDVVSDDDNALARNVSLWKDDAFFTEPDTIYSYSSANFWLAGLIVERVHGKPYADAMSELLFQPLGMKRTFLRPREAMTYPLALGHNRQGTVHGVNRPAANNAAIYPGGSIFSSVNDLSRWLVALLNDGKIDGKQVVDRSVVDSLMKRQFDLPGGDAYYSYGLLGYEIAGVKTISHGGVSRGYGATIFFAPEQKFAYVVLTNSNGQTLPKSRQKANELFLPLKENSSTGSSSTEANGGDLSRYAGRYEHAPQAWEFTARDGKLYVKTDGKESELKSEGPHQFSYPGGPVLFVADKKGNFEHIFMGLYAARRTASAAGK
jgi:CubicO group peptidase (beta-lactamase class C family)